MADFPSPSSAYGVWKVNDVRDALMGGNWPGAFVPVLVGNIGATGSEWALSIAPTGTTLYALRRTATVNGSSVIYRSTNGGVTWTQGATVTGAGSSYGQSVLALSNTTVIVQNNGYFYRSTDSGATFSTLLTTSGGQNNFGNLVSDGTYGYCGGYNRNVITSNNWATASTSALGTITAVFSAPLTNNGSNRFLLVPSGTSGTPNTAYVATTTFTSATSISLSNNQAIAASNSTTGFNAFANYAEGASVANVYYATYPSTTYSTATMTGFTGVASGYPAVTSNNSFIIPTNAGLWLVKTNGTVPAKISTATDFSAICLDIAGARNFGIRLSGEVYVMTAT